MDGARETTGPVDVGRGVDPELARARGLHWQEVYAELSKAIEALNRDDLEGARARVVATKALLEPEAKAARVTT